MRCLCMLGTAHFFFFSLEVGILTGNLRDDTLWKIEVGPGHINGTGLHGAETGEAHLTRVQLLSQGSVTIGRKDDFCLDLAGNRSDTIESKGERMVVGSKSDTEVGCRKVVAVLAETEGIGFNELGGTSELREERDEEPGKERY